MQTNKFFKLFSNFKFVFILVTLFTIIASIQSKPTEKIKEVNGVKEYTDFNNYLIFKQSYFHLIENKDLYKEYPDEYWDLYKYSPTFSLFFSFFAYLPDTLGLLFWNLLNAWLLVFGIYLLPKLDITKKALILLVSLLELLTSLQNEQSNGLIAGLIILSVALLERKHYFFAAFCIVFSIYVKLFGIVALVLFLMYPKKGKLILYSTFWVIILFLLPLLFIDISQYKFIYESWGNMLSNDLAISHGYSVMGWLHTWFGININKMAIVIIGIFMFCLPLIRIKLYESYKYKLLMLASVLIWIVIFNHKAESPTFIIAMAGVSIWFIISEKNKLNSILFILAFIFTSLSPSDIFPRFIRKEWFEPYAIKAVPCIIIWIKIIYDLLKMEIQPKEVK
jgi:hypothetical protein